MKDEQTDPRRTLSFLLLPLDEKVGLHEDVVHRWSKKLRIKLSKDFVLMDCDAPTTL